MSRFHLSSLNVLTFSVQKHPLYPSFLLCSNSDYFLSLSKEIMYNLLSLIVMYFAPLLVIIVTYAMVLYTIARKSREHHQDCRPRSGSNQLRRSDNASNITRARRKTLWLSMVIVTVFVICWTPYVTMTLWYMFDFETAANVDPRIHEALFVTAVSNSCVNPIIYGNYMKKYWRNLRNAACRSRTSSTSSSRIASSSRTHNHHRAVSTYRCTNPNHHFNLSPRCQSATASDVTIMEHTAFGTTGSVISPARITSASAPAASQTELPRPVFV
ncbi:unnamed protein product [Orchesella dallaii]|uniref:G-protein coupled receptors family 1 profile domain-containing protein n=1 Tax=Orchesella dallaii TaxID=48710 RepID=A0ABP1QF07_9HEXA